MTIPAEEKKRYWLKLDKDFLKSPQIKVIKNMPNGKEYVIFYLSLMLESVETIGHLRFSNLVPYNEEMLASITDTNIDIVRSAVKIYESLGLMEVLDDGTIYMTQVAQMTGKESESAERVRRYRLKQKSQEMLQCNGNVTSCNDNKEEQEEEQNTNNNEDIKLIILNTKKNIYKYIEDNFGRPITPIEYEEINNWLSLSFEKKDIEKIILYAIKISVFSNKKTFGYITGILNNWISDKYLTYQQIIDNNNKQINKKEIDPEVKKRLDELKDYDWLNDEDKSIF